MSYNWHGLGESRCHTWKLIGINAVTAGLEIVSSVVFTIVPPLLLKLGYSETQMSYLFGVGKKNDAFSEMQFQNIVRYR